MREKLHGVQGNVVSPGVNEFVAEAIKIVEGLSKTATSAPQKQQIVAFVQTINIKADSQGRAIILTPHVRTGPLDTFAIPIGQADQFIQLLQKVTAETKANAAKTR